MKRNNFTIAKEHSLKSFNVIGDYKGSELPTEFVVVSGHLDNVEAGLGAQDDAVAVLISVNTVRLLKSLRLRPRRTIRTVLWGAEEISVGGANTFIRQHKTELKAGQYVAALEADHGKKNISHFWKAILDIDKTMFASSLNHPHPPPLSLLITE
jgi:Zn-dependent M28 family amino/carboxypeptidase